LTFSRNESFPSITIDPFSPSNNDPHLPLVETDRCRVENGSVINVDGFCCVNWQPIMKNNIRRKLPIFGERKN